NAENFFSTSSFAHAADADSAFEHYKACVDAHNTDSGEAAAAASAALAAELANSIDCADIPDSDDPAVASAVASAVDAAASSAKLAQTKRGKKKRRLADISIKDLEQKELVDMEGNCVLIDPGRGDLIYCMHENSKRDPSKRMVFRYTSAQKTKETRSNRYRKILEKAKKEYEGGKVLRAEAQLSKRSHCTLDPQKFRRYVELRNRVSAVLRPFYERYITASSQQDPEVHTYPLHRKLRLSAFMNQQQADIRLAKNLRAKFGPNPILVMGELVGSQRKVPCSDPRYHGFTVYLIDEFRTSITCPVCFNRLEKFRYVDNPRPWRRRNNPYVLCHRLLRCNSQKCSEAVVKAMAENRERRAQKVNSETQPEPTPRAQARAESRAKANAKIRANAAAMAKGKKKDKKRSRWKEKGEYWEVLLDKPVEKPREKPADLPAVAKPSRIWNRDLVAVLNMRTILLSLRKGNGIPKEFQRGNKTALAAPKPRCGRGRGRGRSKKSVPVNLPAKRPVSNADKGCPVRKKQSKENKSSTQRRSDKGKERDI
ncbi:hypothetical protein FB645_002534, partial [Coemansia sp. IMI 203386]